MNFFRTDSKLSLWLLSPAHHNSKLWDNNKIVLIGARMCGLFMCIDFRSLVSPSDR